jgi:septal ring factor EnvC (AmiA/AmiB activator)
MSVGFDTLLAADALTQAGIAKTHARAIVATMRDAIGDHVATKSDIGGMSTEIAGLKTDLAVVKTDVAELKTDVAALKTDVAELKTDVAGLKTDVAELKTDVAGLKTDVAAVRTEVAESKAALTWRIVLALGVFAALTRIMP